jgi:hypothetical protein
MKSSPIHYSLAVDDFGKAYFFVPWIMAGKRPSIVIGLPEPHGDDESLCSLDLKSGAIDVVARFSFPVSQADVGDLTDERAVLLCVHRTHLVCILFGSKNYVIDTSMLATRTPR